MMSTVYTYSEARQNLSTLLEEAIREGEVRVRRKDGQTFLIVPEVTNRSPLDVDGIDIDLSAEEIVEFIHDGRRKYG